MEENKMTLDGHLQSAIMQAGGGALERPHCARSPPMKRLTATATFVAVLAAAYPSAADWPGGGPRMSESLCRAPETALFSCRISTKVVSICGQPEGE